MSASGERSDPTLREIYSADQVRARIAELADRLRFDYQDLSPVFVVIAEGARRFAEELVERVQARGMEPEVVFLRATRTQGATLGEVEIEAIDPIHFKDGDVLIIDDIADEGRTLEAVWGLVSQGAPSTLRAAVLVSKQGRRKVKLALEYVCFELEKGWVVGFGMDLDGRFRELDHLAVVEGLV